MSADAGKVSDNSDQSECCKYRVHQYVGRNRPGLFCHKDSSKFGWTSLIGYMVESSLSSLTTFHNLLKIFFLTFFIWGDGTLVHTAYKVCFQSSLPGIIIITIFFILVFVLLNHSKLTTKCYEFTYTIHCTHLQYIIFRWLESIVLMEYWVHIIRFLREHCTIGILSTYIQVAERALYYWNIKYIYSGCWESIVLLEYWVYIFRLLREHCTIGTMST